jgi:TonB family protein
MQSWLRARKESKETAPEETLIRICVVSRDEALVDEVHKDLMVGFSTRGGYDFEADHPDFQHYCDVLFVDLRGAGSGGAAEPAATTNDAVGTSAVSATDEGLAFIDAIRKSVSHPPIVALCDIDAGEFARAVMRHGAYERLTAPLHMSQLRLALQRAYEFRQAESRLENFLAEQTAAHENSKTVAKRKRRGATRAAASVAASAPRHARGVRKSAAKSAPSRLAIGFVLGCVIFFAIIVGVRTLLTGMSDALASAGFTNDSSAAATAGGNRAGLPSHLRQFNGVADVATAETSTDAARLSLRGDNIAGPLGARGVIPGYEPAAIVERVTPRYSAEARAAHLQGTVRIRAVIGRDGVPFGLARVSGDPMLAQIAMDAISLWRYTPATIDGSPVESELIIPVQFQLPD